MSVRLVSLKNSTFRFSLIAALLALCGEVGAIGLGELRGRAVLGDRARFAVDILEAGQGAPGAACFRLIKPSGDESMPWLKGGALTVRNGTQPVLQIRSDAPLTDPALAVAIYVGCGHDVVREYVVLTLLPTERAVEMADPDGSRPAAVVKPVEHQRSTVASPAVATPRGEALRGGGMRLVPASPPAAVVQDTARPDPTDRLRNIEATIGELQQRAAELTKKIEQTAANPEAGQAGRPEAAPASLPPAPEQPARIAPVARSAGGSDWTFYAALAAALLALAAWWVWRNSRRYSPEDPAGDEDVEVDPQRKDEYDERGGVDLRVDSVVMAMPMPMPMTLDVDVAAPAAAPDVGTASSQDFINSIVGAEADQHLEINPAMELAEIMLSFGRVKGAAQTLQEFVENNPQEAVMPWIRLMEVCRMAGMRKEFEKVALDLNKNFNVEIQKWEETAELASDGAVDLILDTEPVAVNKVEGIEAMPSVMERVVMRWQQGEVIDYLNQLLRDNRGGTRLGFPLPVVSDIQFLIDLKKVSNKMESESKES